MALLDKYRALVDGGVIAPDPAQSIAAARLDGLAGRLRKWKRRTGLAAVLRGKEPAPKGLYVFGQVGRGKTMLMDLFFQTVAFRPKRRATSRCAGFSAGMPSISTVWKRRAMCR